MLKWTWIALAVIIVDQWTKALATEHLQMFRPVEVMPMLNWTLMHNTGAAFSFLSDAGGWQRWFFTVLAIGVSIALIIWIYRLPRHEKMQAITLSLVLGGAIGNVIDRLRFGYVVDFIDVYWKDYHWPAFNIADSAISVGAVLLLILSFRSDKADKDNKSSES